MPTYKLNVNGVVRNVEAVSDMPLLWVLRDLLGLTGTKYGCGVASCGACSVLIDGEEVLSCQLSVSEVGKKRITTIEGLSKDGSHPVQKAWMKHDVPQCGYCQSGQIIAAAALLKKHPRPTDEQINDALASHVCRCGTYNRVRAAIHSAAEMTAGGKK